MSLLAIDGMPMHAIFKTATSDGKLGELLSYGDYTYTKSPFIDGVILVTVC